MSPRWPRLVAATATGVAVALLLTAVLAVRSVPVSTRAELEDVGFGWPLAWLRQDQGALDPPLPARVRPLSPLEHPSQVLAGPLALDVLLLVVVVGAVMVAGTLVVGRAARR